MDGYSASLENNSPRTKSPVEEVIEPRKSKEDEWGKSEREHRL